VQTADIAAGLRLTGGDGSKCGLCYLENLRRCWGARERVKAKRKERDELGGGGGPEGHLDHGAAPRRRPGGGGGGPPTRASWTSVRPPGAMRTGVRVSISSQLLIGSATGSAGHCRCTSLGLAWAPPHAVTSS
jgi:hypothetical protein